MLRFYPIVIIIQLFCLYHAYTNRSEQKWFWFIIFFPFVGSLMYLYDHFYNRSSLSTLKEGVKGTFITNYKLKQLEHTVKFSDTHANKIELATEHLNVGNHERALEIFESCLVGSYKKDDHLNMKLVKVHYLMGNYEKVIEHGANLTSLKEFKNSSEMISLGWAYYKTGNTKEALHTFEKMDLRYCNYENRLEYAYLLQDAVGKHEAKDKVVELLDEIEGLGSYERKENHRAIKGIKQLYKEL